MTARQTGIERSRSEYFVVMDSHMEVLTGKGICTSPFEEYQINPALYITLFLYHVLKITKPLCNPTK